MVTQRNHLCAKVVCHHVQDVVELHDPEILQQLNHRRATALELGYNLLVLQVVNQPLLPHE